MECKIEGCGNRSKSRGLCNNHYQKEWRRIQALKDDGPTRARSTVTQPHRAAMARYLGRPLSSYEQVRLKQPDGGLGIGNLEVWSKMGTPSSGRVVDLLDYADRVLLKYDGERKKHGAQDRLEPAHFEVAYWDGDKRVHLPIWYFSAEQAELGWEFDSRSREFPSYEIWNSLTYERTPGRRSRTPRQKPREDAERWGVVVLDNENRMQDAGLGEFTNTAHAREAGHGFKSRTGKPFWLKDLNTGKIFSSKA